MPELGGRGYDVVALARSTPHMRRFGWGAGVSWVQADASDPAAVAAALAGADTLMYLVHSLAGADFAARDVAAACAVRSAVTAAGVRRVVYLSGLVPADGRVSEHLASRHEVERLLGESTAETLTLRAGMIVGAGSTSFEILRQVAALTPLQAVPPTLRSRVQPVGIGDVVTALADATAGSVVGVRDLGGPDVLSYADLLQRYGELAGLPRLQVPALPAPAGVAVALTGLLSAAPLRTVAALVPSLAHDLVCRPAPHLLLAPTGAAEAIRRSLRPPADAGEATRYGGDPYVAAGSDPAWTRVPQVDGVPRLVATAAHVAGHRLRGLLTALTPPR